MNDTIYRHDPDWLENTARRAERREDWSEAARAACELVRVSPRQGVALLQRQFTAIKAVVRQPSTGPPLRECLATMPPALAMMASLRTLDAGFAPMGVARWWFSFGYLCFDLAGWIVPGPWVASQLAREWNHYAQEEWLFRWRLAGWTKTPRGFKVDGIPRRGDVDGPASVEFGRYGPVARPFKDGRQAKIARFLDLPTVPEWLTSQVREAAE